MSKHMETRRDCFAGTAGKCRCLKDQDCSKCKFFKTSMQLEDEKLDCRKRLNRLPVETRQHIADKYGFYL